MTSPDVVIVGGTSPLGRVVAARLRASGAAVVTTGRRGGDLQLDLEDPDQVAAVASAGTPAVVFLARWLGPMDDRAGIDRFVDSSRRFFELSYANGTRRVVFASSGAVYGPAWERAVTETDPACGSSAYARLKLLTEAALEASVTPGAVAVALRIFNVYGPGLDNSLVNRLLSREERPRLLMSSSYVRDYIHAEDVAEACRAALTADLPEYTAINVGTGAPTDNVALARLAGDEAFEAVASDAVDVSLADIDRARRLLGFVPQHRLEEAFGAR